MLASGVIALAVLVLASNAGVDGLKPVFNPLAMPAVPLLPALGIVIAAAPAWLTPALPSIPMRPAAR